MTRAQEIAYLQGKLSSQKLQNGLNDGRPGVRAAAEALRAELIARLASLGVDAYNSGLSVSSNVAAGIYSNAHLVDGASSYLASKISGYLPRSDAEKGPLSNITKVGPAIVSTIVDGIKSSLSMADSASGSLASALAIGSVSGPQGAGGASDASGGVTVNLTVQGDLRASERTLPGMIVRSLYASGLTPQ